ncbi:MAG: GNAT family N-acetyltransferase [Actinomycetota bacterium]|nr:GNAT family N-acetyltransferase [Actinomycetota bacterium]
MELRPATAADLPAQEKVFHAAIGEVYERHNLPAPTPPSEAFHAHHRHLLRHDGERCWVAEEEGRVVGFSAALARGDAWHLASLFIAPGRQGVGIGKRLLEHAWGDGYANRRVLTDAIQPVSNGLYASRGLIPVAPMLHLGGMVSARASELVPGEPEPSTLAALDRAAYGFDRAVDHAHWQELGRCTVWLRGGEPCAYSYTYAWDTIGPVAGLDGPAAAEAFRAELLRAEGSVSLVVPGTSRELVTAALEAGLRFTRPPGLLLLGHGVEPPRALAISGYSLF